MQSTAQRVRTTNSDAGDSKRNVRKRPERLCRSDTSPEDTSPDSIDFDPVPTTNSTSSATTTAHQHQHQHQHQHHQQQQYDDNNNNNNFHRNNTLNDYSTTTDNAVPSPDYGFFDDDFDSSDQEEDLFASPASTTSSSSSRSSSSVNSPYPFFSSTMPASNGRGTNTTAAAAAAARSSMSLDDEYFQIISPQLHLTYTKIAITRYPFESAALQQLFAPREFGHLDAATPKWVRMAFYALIAIVVHCMGNVTARQALERRMRELAGELFDYIHPGVASAFAFTARYYWALKKEMSEYYSRVAVGLCQQLLQKFTHRDCLLVGDVPSSSSSSSSSTKRTDVPLTPASPTCDSPTTDTPIGSTDSYDPTVAAAAVAAAAISTSTEPTISSDTTTTTAPATPFATCSTPTAIPETSPAAALSKIHGRDAVLDSPEFILQVQLFASSLCGLASTPWHTQVMLTTMNQLEQIVTDHEQFMLACPVKFAFMRMMLNVRIRVSQAIRTAIEAGDCLMSGINFSSQESAQLLASLDMVESSSVENKAINRWLRPLMTIGIMCTRILIYLGNRQYDTCLALARVVLTLYEERKSLLQHAHPLMAELIYWLVRICHTLNQPHLARRALVILRQQIVCTPAYRHLLDDATKLMASAPQQLATMSADQLLVQHFIAATVAPGMMQVPTRIPSNTFTSLSSSASGISTFATLQSPQLSAAPSPLFQPPFSSCTSASNSTASVGTISACNSANAPLSPLFSGAQMFGNSSSNHNIFSPLSPSDLVQALGMTTMPSSPSASASNTHSSSSSSSSSSNSNTNSNSYMWDQGSQVPPWVAASPGAYSTAYGEASLMDERQ
jgi:hypothetical protein